MANWERVLLSSLVDPGKSPDYRKVLEVGITPNDFLDPMTRQMMFWVDNYWKSYGRCPSMELLYSEFPNFEPINISEELEAICAKVKDDILKGLLRKLCEQVSNILQTDPLKGIHFLEENIDTLKKKFKFALGKDVLPSSVVEGIKQEYEIISSGQFPGISYPWPFLNSVSRGMKKGELIVFYAPPKMCKTWLLLNCVLHCIDMGRRVLLTSIEMPPFQIYWRLTALIGKLNYSDFNKGQLTTESQKAFELATMKLASYDNLLVSDGRNDDGRATVSSIIRKAKEFKPDIIVADSIHRMADDRSSAKQVKDYKYFTNITQDMKEDRKSTRLNSSHTT